MAGANETFVFDIAAVLGASAVGGFVAHRLRQPALLGYLLAGCIVGPFGFGLISQIEEIQSLAEIGVAFLLFALGVEFSLAELKRVKDIALKGSLLQISLTIALVASLTIALGWVGSTSEGIFMGAVLSLSSTAVVLKTLTERGEVNTIHGQVMLAILIAQDLALGLMLAVLPALNQPDNFFPALGIAVLKALLFFLGAIAAGYWIIPRMMSTVAKTESSELFLLTVIALCLGIALVTANLGLSIEMGAFVAGLTIAEIDYADRALSKIIPLRDTFASLFFASIGMLINPVTLWGNLGVIIGLVALVTIGKAGIIFPIVWRFGYSFKTAVISSLGLNQIGEFSFVLAATGQTLGLLDRAQYDLLIGTTATTLVLTPISMKLAPQIANKISAIPVVTRFLARQQNRGISVPQTIANHIVVAGYGRVGRVLVKLLRDRQYTVLVIENSEAAIRGLRLEQIPYIYGDADSELVLKKARLDRAKAIAIALPDPSSTRILLQLAIQTNPNIDIVARSHSDREIDLLTTLGAAEVVQPEFEAALEMGRQILSTLGEDDRQVSKIVREIRTDRYLSVRDYAEKVNQAKRRNNS